MQPVPLVPCMKCQQMIPFGTPQCPGCGQQYELRRPGEQLGDSAGMRALLPVGRTGLSIAAGYVGLIALILWPLGPIAILLGILAVLDLNKKPGSHGMGRAVFAIVGGALGTAFLALFLVGTLK